MASPFVSARVNDVAVEVQLEEGGPFFGLISIFGMDPTPLARATDDDFVVALPELLNMAGVLDEPFFKDGQKVPCELENTATNEVEDHTVICTVAKFEYAKAHPQGRSRPPAGTGDDQEMIENEHMAEMDDAANHARLDAMKRAQQKRMMIALTAEAINSVVKMAKANGLSQAHVEQAFVAAGGTLPTHEDREAFENDEDEDEDVQGHPGAGQQAQCPQQ
jgi:hypothetical protein